MDRKETATPNRSGYANQREVGEGTARTLRGPTGHQDNKGADPGTMAAEEIDQPVGAQPRSGVTGRHDPGTGANETADGLSGTEEMTRQAAEDTALGEREGDSPVFDRGQRIPRR